MRLVKVGGRDDQGCGDIWTGRSKGGKMTTIQTSKENS